MNDAKKAAIQTIDDHAALFCDVSRKIWEYAELSLKEFQSAALYEKVLAENGFAVTSNMGGIKTAFCGSWGHGHPVIGILGEFDALSGLSQQAGCTHHAPLIPGGSGHGCGHNLLGAGSLAAAFAVKAYLEQHPEQEGTVIFFGCPGEEGGAGKAFLACDHVWEHLDAAVTWHPSDVNEVASGTCVSCIQKEFHFHGVASHASGTPHLGRSALDAVELMNIGVQFLREHMPTTARIHYAITDAGGKSPNVVQPEAKVLYMVRDVQVAQAIALQKRVDQIAKAAAMMTETTVTEQFIDGTANTVPNAVLEKVAYDNFEALGVVKHSDEEMQLAQAYIDSYEAKSDRVPGFASAESPEIAAYVKKMTDNGKLPINDFLMPLHHSMKSGAGSTDVGDVSWQTPTVQVHTACWPSGAPGHSWQNVSCGATSIAEKSMLQAGKVMAGTVIDLLTKPDVLGAAKAEFKEAAAAGYTCPIPPDAVPVAIED